MRAWCGTYLGSWAIRSWIAKTLDRQDFGSPRITANQNSQGGSNAQISNDAGHHRGGRNNCDGGVGAGAGAGADAGLAEGSGIFETLLHQGAREGAVARGADADAAAPSEP